MARGSEGSLHCRSDLLCVWGQARARSARRPSADPLRGLEPLLWSAVRYVELDPGARADPRACGASGPHNRSPPGRIYPFAVTDVVGPECAMLRPERKGDMIERFTETKRTLARLRASEGAEYLDAFAEALFSTGYTRRSGIRYVNAAAHLGNWCRDALSLIHI